MPLGVTNFVLIDVGGANCDFPPVATHDSKAMGRIATAASCRRRARRDACSLTCDAKRWCADREDAADIVAANSSFYDLFAPVTDRVSHRDVYDVT